MDVVVLFRMNDGHDDLANKTEADEPLLVISEPIVFVGVRHALEHLLRIDEVESVLAEILPSFRLIPGNHQWNVYTLRILVKQQLAPVVP